MTQDYIDSIKNNNYSEYICGKYEVGRYAWVLENIEKLDKQIFANGKLNIWNYKEEE